MNRKESISESTKIQWHPGFYAATEIELRSNKNDLHFIREYNLSKKPLQIDMLIIEKLKNVQIQNEIGKLFRKYNVIEYKSPDDEMNIDDFFKTVGYAYLYKGLGEKVNQIPLEELTASLFRERKPRVLMKELTKYGCVIEKYVPGIYYIKGLMIPVQIIVTKELKNREHLPLKVLSQQADESDIRDFVDYVSQFKEPGDRRNADAVLQVSVQANRKIFGEIRRRSQDMCDALKEFFKEDLEEAHARGREEGSRQEARRISMLTARLLKEKRLEDLQRSTEDDEYREQLLKEYGIE